MPVPSKPLTTTMNNLRDDILQNVILVCCGIALQNFRSMVRSLSVNDSSLVDFNVLGLILVKTMG
jgi:hypothetical protein